MTSWTVRLADRSDHNAVVALEAQAFGSRSWGAHSVRASLASLREAVLLVAGADETPVGFAMWRKVGEDAELLAIAVIEMARRKGAGAMLLQSVLDQARNAGVERVLLDVAADNAAAIALYRDAGFALMSVRRGYYKDGVDAMVMQIAL